MIKFSKLIWITVQIQQFLEGFFFMALISNIEGVGLGGYLCCLRALVMIVILNLFLDKICCVKITNGDNNGDNKEVTICD